MFAGIFTSLLVPETKRKTLERLAGEVEGTPEYDPENVRNKDTEKAVELKEGVGVRMRRDRVWDGQ